MAPATPMIPKLYSYALVACQFCLIAVLIIRQSSGIFSPLPLTFFCLGIAIGLYALKDNKLDNFNIIPDIKENASLITTGAYAYVRHPMYFSVSVMMLGVVLSHVTFLNLLYYLALIATLFLKADKEERLWSRECEDYRAYMKTTKKFIPFVL